MRRLSIADWISLAISSAILLTVLIAPRLSDLKLLPDETLCLSQRIAGIECPGCGMTRATVALGRGALGSALRINWIAPSLAALALLHLGLRGWKLARPRLQLRNFDLATVGVVIVIYVVRTAQIW